MNIESIVEKAKKSRYLILSDSELKSLLSSSNVLQEKETYISDKIRLLKFRDKILIQEKTDKDEYLVRLMKTKKEAEDLIQERIEVYEKMWDGCGCKVEYYK